jgi:curved DNA-binding protein CbpA
MKDPFKVFGLSKTQKYSQSALKEKYFLLIRKYPPERYPEKFKEIRRAYDTLRNARSPYDLLAIAPIPHSGKTFNNAGNLNMENIKLELKKQIILKELGG